MSIRATIFTILAVAIVLMLGAFLAFQVSPWPGAWLIRRGFNQAGSETSRQLEKHVPLNVTAIFNEQYDLSSEDAWLDVYFPDNIKADSVLTTVVWIHGGAWIAGSKNEVSNYCKILASRGFTVVAVDYSLAPGSIYPTPLRQVNEALRYISENSARLHIDASRLVLAGDSGGAHIASQFANLVYYPLYAERLQIQPSVSPASLKGVILFCGTYSISDVSLEGPYGSFLKTVLWSYCGDKDFKSNPGFATADVIRYITPAHPPVFISVGNGDPLSGQSYRYASKLVSLKIPVDSLFFPSGRVPSLSHEYQFNLDTEEGKMALDRCVMFVEKLKTKSDRNQ